MMPFEEGWIPRGWTRGEKLYHRPAQNLPGRFTGTIEPLVEMVDGWPSVPPLGPGDVVPDVVIVRYDWSERGKVMKWLEWWTAVKSDASAWNPNGR